MSSYKEPTFQERTALANKAKQTALKQLREKPVADEATLAARRQTAKDRDAAQRQASAEKVAARDLAKAQKREQAKQSADAAAAVAPPLTPEDQKAARDAKYAARKNRVGRK